MRLDARRKGTVMESILEWFGFIETGTVNFRYENKEVYLGCEVKSW